MQITDGKGKLVLLGPDSVVKQMLLSALERSVAGDAVCVSGAEEPGKAAKRESIVCAARTWETELKQEDCVLLFGRYGADASTADAGWIGELLDAIDQIQKSRPREVLFLSDTMVYGKLFGEQHLLGENEIGYVCHTSEKETTAQWMRTAEHFCTRLAREEGLSVKIIRADWEHIPAVPPEGGESGPILNSILDILENGVAGEAYNISDLTRDTLTGKNEQYARERSPLSPVRVLPDIGKAEKYAAS